MNCTVAIISSFTMAKPDTCRETNTGVNTFPFKGVWLLKENRPDLDSEFGVVQGDQLHGSDDLPGLLHFSSYNKVKVGLLHQMLHVATSLDGHQLLHTWTPTQKSPPVSIFQLQLIDAEPFLYCMLM